MANLIFGCGYLGRRVAESWVAAGQQVAAVTRGPDRAAELAKIQVAGIVADITRPETLASLPPAETVLFCVGYDRSMAVDGRPSLREVYVGGLRNVLDAIECRRFLYVSTTGVYGAGTGEWVNEDTPPSPTYETARICLGAEQLVRERFETANVSLAVSNRPSASVLRLAGIYGPGRVPKLDALLAGEPIACAEQGWLNLIHVDDAAAVVRAVAECESPPSLLLVSDGCPVQRREFYREAARLAGAPPPSFIDPPSDAATRGRGAANRRIDNARMRTLGITLQFPSYREGLASALSTSREAVFTSPRIS